MSNVKIISKLGEGYSGSAYLGLVDDKKCIIKKTHIDNNDICGIDDEVSRRFNEIAKLYPDHFMILISRGYIFEYKCFSRCYTVYLTVKKQYETFSNNIFFSRLTKTTRAKIG